VVPCNYIQDMKTAGIRDLKAHLSAYLHEVERGEVLLVTDRGRVVAEMRPPGAAERSASPAELRYRRLVESGLLRPAADPDALSAVRPPDLRLPAGTANDLLSAGREE
jgi:antitoxin (DNA-binding transcriptional repressor) of toxin-antitoxin stability system